MLTGYMLYYPDLKHVLSQMEYPGEERKDCANYEKQKMQLQMRKMPGESTPQEYLESFIKSFIWHILVIKVLVVIVLLFFHWNWTMTIFLFKHMGMLAGFLIFSVLAGSGSWLTCFLLSFCGFSLFCLSDFFFISPDSTLMTNA